LQSARLTRRELALTALAASALPAADKPYASALDGFESKVTLSEFDPVGWTRERWKTAPLKLTYRPGSEKDTVAWQKKLRPKLLELMGGFPDGKIPIEAGLLESREFPGYRRDKFVFETRPGMASLAYLLVPKNAAGRQPAVICVPGHGRGVDDIVGVDKQGRDRTDKDGYQHDFALQAVEAGLVAVAVEPVGFGCRRDTVTAKKGLGNSACQPAAGAALLFGETIIGWRIWDIIRTIDWMETRPEINAKQIGCMGISGGGMCTLFAAALEPRIKASFVSGYLNTFRDSILSLSHCIDNYVPGILNWAEMYDIGGLVAPRPMYVESGDQDNIFPIAASRESFAKVQSVYRAFGAEDRTQHEIFSGEHSFHGGGGLPFLKRWLTA